MSHSITQINPTEKGVYHCGKLHLLGKSSDREKDRRMRRTIMDTVLKSLSVKFKCRVCTLQQLHGKLIKDIFEKEYASWKEKTLQKLLTE